MIGGKKIQNFITFQTKQTIFLKQNEPELIVHQQTIQTDSFKQLLSTKRSKKKPNKQYISNPFRDSKEKPCKKSNDHKKSQFSSSNSKSKNNSKEPSTSKNQHYLQNHPLKHTFKQFDSKKSKSNKNRISKKVKSMIRLPKFIDKTIPQFEKSKICRKSYSPSRNLSEGLKKNHNHNNNDSSTQCLKTIKILDSKENTCIKHIKSVKNQKNVKKQTNENKYKSTQSKEKIKSNIASKKNINDTKNYITEKKKQDDFFNRIDVAEKVKKVQKKISPTKKSQNQKKKIQETVNKQTRMPRQKIFSKKRKSMSKSKKNLYHFESVDEMALRHQGYETTRNEITGLSNYLSSRDSLKKKVKTDRDSFNKPKKKSKELSKQKSLIFSSKNLQKNRNDAAIKIQKVYKGYITRKWLKQYLKIINGAVVIQKHWRGYLERKRLRKAKENLNIKIQKTKIIAQIDPLKLQNEDSFIQQNKINIEKWKNILFEVMSEQTVNQVLKSRIKHFLQNQEQSARGSIVSQISQKSHISEQKLQEEMMSERRYFEKKNHKKEELSNSGRKSKKYLQSPQSFYIANDHSLIIEQQGLSNRRSWIKQPGIASHLISPSTSMPISPKLVKSQSADKIIQNLQGIKKQQRNNIILQAESKKRQIKFLLENNKCSPTSYQKRQKIIDLKMQNSLRKFEDSIKDVIENCSKNSPIGLGISQVYSYTESVMITPQNSQVREALVREELENLSEDQVKSRLFEKVQNGLDLRMNSNPVIQLKQTQSINLQTLPQVPTYQNFETFNINAFSSQHSQKAPSITPIDTSCSFLDQYLLTMIEYLRNKNDGNVMSEIVRSVKTVKNLTAYTVLRNLAVVKEENSVEEDGFCLPLYKYLQDDSEILKSQQVQDYNKYFQMMKSTHKFQSRKVQNKQENQPLQHYMKLLIDSFNEALNLKRPSIYIFTDHSIESFNSKIIIQRQQYDLESQYDMYCATAMQEIFNWFNVKYGCIVSAQTEEQNGLEQVITQNATRLQQMMKMEVEKKWDEYYERIQTIAKVSDELFDEIIFKETLTIINLNRSSQKQKQ